MHQLLMKYKEVQAWPRAVARILEGGGGGQHRLSTLFLIIIVVQGMEQN